MDNANSPGGSGRFVTTAQLRLREQQREAKRLISAWLVGDVVMPLLCLLVFLDSAWGVGKPMPPFVAGPWSLFAIWQVVFSCIPVRTCAAIAKGMVFPGAAGYSGDGSLTVTRLSLLAFGSTDLLWLGQIALFYSDGPRRPFTFLIALLGVILVGTLVISWPEALSRLATMGEIITHIPKKAFLWVVTRVKAAASRFYPRRNGHIGAGAGTA